MMSAALTKSNRFQHFLQRSLDVLQRELPLGYGEVARRLGKRAVKIDVDGERLCIVGDGAELVIASTALRPTAAAFGSSRALRAILEGEHTLDSAILADAITLQGPLPELAAFYETLHAYFSSAVRCPSFAQLLDEYFQSNHDAAATSNGAR